MASDCYRDSKEQLFALLARLRVRVRRLIDPAAANLVPPSLDDADLVERALEAQVELRLPRLTWLFRLQPLAVDALVCLVAAEYDPIFRLVGRTLQRESGVPWLELGTIAEILDVPPNVMPELASLFTADGVLCRNALVMVERDAHTPAAATRVKVVERVAEYLAGIDKAPRGVKLVAPSAAPIASLVPAATCEAACARLRRALLSSEPLLIEIAGPAGCGKRRLATQLATELGTQLVIIDLALTARDDLESALATGRREAALSGGLLCLAHLEAQLPSTRLARASGEAGEEEPPAARPLRLPPSLERFVTELDGPLLLTVKEHEPLLDLIAPTLMVVDAPFPTPGQRAALLGDALEARGAALAGDVDLPAVARRFALDPGRLAAAAAAAVEHAGRRGPDEPVGAADLTQACGRQLRHDLISVAERVVSGHRWEDLVIASDAYDALREMVGYARNAEHVYDTWGFGSRHSLARGLSALFAGPPGTGKTMCASVMARELDMELFRVDLSRVVSKWIGETEKNLAKIFDEAQRSNAIILFDEADSLFAKRTEVKSSVDRYANLEVNFLLQRMEAFSGVTILTTNFENTIDTAFKRRLTFRIHFEKPDAAARAALWEKMFPAECALASDVDVERLGQLYEISGGNIRNAALRAGFLAAAEGHDVDMRTCMTAAEREAREMGLLVKSHREAAASEPAEPAPAPAPAPSGREVPLIARAPRIVPISHRR